MNAFTWAGPAETGVFFRGSKGPPPVIKKFPKPAPPNVRKKRVRPLMAKSEKRSAGPQANVDMARLVDLKSQGLSIQAIAEKMGHGYNTIVSRLKGMK